MKETLLAVVVVLLVLMLVATWAVLYQIIKQQGRVLLHLDDIEQHLANARQGAPATGSRANGTQAQPRGLTVGALMPPFRLPDLTGHMVALEDLRGKRVLLVHWSSQCGFCNKIAPDL